LLTVMTFSVATAALNLASLGLTAKYVVHQLSAVSPGEPLGQISLPDLSIVGYLIAALLPMSALFSALCLACAAFARSSKEGQYYLMPLLLVMMPLMMLPMSPGVELNLGNSLIPVTGVVLLLRALMEGHYVDALPYIAPVCGVTLFCCLLAIRWAVYQFSHESVLFRESERLDLRRWLVHLVRDRHDTPTLPAAFFCVALIFFVQFFTQLAVSSHTPAEPGFRYLALLLGISQVVCIALPALLMTFLLTARPRQTLLLDRSPRGTACLAAVALAVLLQPVGQYLQIWIQQLYPLQESIHASTQAFSRLLESAPYVWLPFLLMAVLPALCEEIAFRGFILSGLRRIGNKWWAISLSAVFFGMAHTVVQQSIAAAALGLVIGFLAVQSGSLIPGILFHAIYNGLMLALALLPKHIGAWAEQWPAVRLLLVEAEPGIYAYRWQVAVLSGGAAVAVLWWFHRLPFRATQEEQLSSARARQTEATAIGHAFQPEAADPTL
jgi:sodium transport system permease protein